MLYTIYRPDQVFSYIYFCQFVYNILTFSTVEFGIQFLIPAFLAVVTAFLTLFCFVCSEPGLLSCHCLATC